MIKPDFDGVIHSYTSGWKGADVIPDPVVEGIQSTINSLRQEDYEVIIVSTRCACPEGMSAVKKYLADNNIVVDAVMKEKSPAICYIDDRAICFDGHPDLHYINLFVLQYLPQKSSFHSCRSSLCTGRRFYCYCIAKDGNMIL